MSIALPEVQDLLNESAGTRVTKAASPTPPGPLTPEHFVQLEQARLRSKKIRRACGVAALSGWTTVGFGALALPFALFDLTTLVLSLALLAIGTNELRSRRMLLRLDLRAPRRLALNQVIFIVVLVSYAAWSLFKGLTTQSQMSAALANEPGMESTLQLVEGMERMFVVGVYGTMIVASIIFQGGAALYYASRTRHLQRYIQDTPDWIKDLQARGQQV